MVSITRCCPKRLLERLAGWLLAALLCGLPAAQAQSAPQLTLERSDDAILLSVQLAVDLPSVVEDALLKGIPINFVARADLLRERWYWTNKRVASAQRHLRLSYYPLTRRWRLGTAFGDVGDAGQGLTLNQSFDTLPDALAAVRRISRWKIADPAQVEAGARYLVEFSFQLDTAQLPRPLQIGTQGQSDWTMALSATQELPAGFLK